MTSTRYIIERIAGALGFQRKSQRLNEAAQAMPLLRDAEGHLGVAIWRKTEDIESLSTEYWTLRKLAKKQEDLQQQLQVCEQQLDSANHERAALLMRQVEFENPEIAKERKDLLTSLEGLAKQRDEVIREGRAIRRLYNGAKLKLEVLDDETDRRTKDIEDIKERLAQYKARFIELKAARDETAAKIRAGDVEMDGINARMKAHAKKNHAAASEAFMVINQVNKEVWQLRAEIGLLETRMHQFQTEIGRYVSRHASHDKQCAAAAASHQGLVDVMRALRRSIALNHKLAGRI